MLSTWSIGRAQGWVVTVINNHGVFKPQQGMAQVDRNARGNRDGRTARAMRIKRAVGLDQ